MPKVFDMVHKVSDQENSEGRIPFEDDNKDQAAKSPKSRPRVEIIFFYILLFVIFFIMGAAFLSPNLLGGLFGSSKTPEASPSPLDSPAAGFTLEKAGQGSPEAAGELGAKPTSDPVSSSAIQSPPASQPAQAAAASKIQILNGTNREGAAAALRTKLAKAGIVVASIGNYHKRTVRNTTIFFDPAYETAAQQVKTVTGGILAATTDGIGGNHILVVIGANN